MQKKKKLIILIVIIVLTIFISTSFAYFIFETNQEGQNVASSECFKLTFSDKNNISLLDTVPLSEEEASVLTPYEFTIKNVCKQAANYYVNIETLNGSTMSENYLRYKLDDEESYILGTLENNETLINNNAISSRTIKRAILLPNEEITYNLRLWIDENASIEAADKIYNSKVVISATLNKNPYVEIALNANGGSLENNSISVVEGRKLTSLPTPTKKGYVFLGWYYSSTLEDEYVASNDDLADKSITNLYAKYIEGTYKLSIDPNKGEYNNSPGVYEVNVTYKDTYELLEPTKEGYTFESWSVESGEETSVSNNIVTMGKEDSYVKANYNINTYKLSVDPNTGTWNNSSVVQEFDMDYNTTKEIANPLREGYTFIGWSITSGDLSGTTYTIGADNATLTANWQVNDYKWIVYHNKMNVSGSGYTLSDTEAGHGNYGTTFSGTLKNYTGFQNPAQTSETIGVDVKYSEEGTPTNNVLNYNYERNKYSVEVNPNGGTYNSTTSNTTHSNIYYEATYTINNPSKTGYNFSGWTVSGAGSSISGTTFKMGQENASLLANWSAKTYTLTLNNQSATSSGTTTLTATYDSALPSITIPSRTGYAFGGYYTEENGSGTQYIKADGTSARNYDLDENKTLYAKWSANTYTVTLVGNDVIETGYEEKVVTLNTNVSTGASGYSYAKTLSLSTNTNYIVSFDYVIDSGTNIFDVDLYPDTLPQIYATATTTKQHYDWILSSSNSNMSSSILRFFDDHLPSTDSGIITISNVMLSKQINVTATYGSAMPSITVPTRTGYTFGGYYTGTNGSGTQYIKADGTSARNFDKTAATTLYAKWTADTYTVTYDYNYLSNDILSTSLSTDNFTIFKVSSYTLTDYLDTYGKGYQFNFISVGQDYEGGYFKWGQSLTINNVYTLSFEAKANKSTRVSISAEQCGGYPIYNLTTDWNRYTFTFKARKEGGALVLYFLGNTTGDNVTLYTRNMYFASGNLYTTSSSKQVYSALGTLPTAPTRSGYTFKGWFTDPIGGTQVSSSTTIPYNANKTYNLYAHWTLN